MPAPPRFQVDAPYTLLGVGLIASTLFVICLVLLACFDWQHLAFRFVPVQR